MGSLVTENYPVLQPRQNSWLLTILIRLNRKGGDALLIELNFFYETEYYEHAIHNDVT